MSRDARQSLIAVGSVLLFVALFWLGLTYLDATLIPDWVLPAGLALTTVNLLWSLARLLRSKRTPRATP